jgi:hypothetical protein
LAPLKSGARLKTAFSFTFKEEEMKKALLVMALALAMAANSFAAVAAAAPAANISKVKAGLMAGVGISNIRTDVITDTMESIGPKLGFQVGGFVEFAAGNMIGIQPEVLFSAKGAKFSNNSGVELFDAEMDGVSLNYNYISIPVLLKVKFGAANSSTRWNVFMGPELGILMSANASFEGESEDIKEGFKGTDMGLMFGVGVDIQKVQVGFRYSMGLTNTPDLDMEGYSWKNIGMGLTLGYSFM